MDLYSSVAVITGMPCSLCPCSCYPTNMYPKSETPPRLVLGLGGPGKALSLNKHSARDPVRVFACWVIVSCPHLASSASMTELSNLLTFVPA